MADFPWIGANNNYFKIGQSIQSCSTRTEQGMINSTLDCSINTASHCVTETRGRRK